MKAYVTFEVLVSTSAHRLTREKTLENAIGHHGVREARAGALVGFGAPTRDDRERADVHEDGLFARSN